MHPPDPEMRNRPAANGTANRIGDYLKPEESNEPFQRPQGRSPLKLQVFCLARRFALSAPMAEAVAPLVYGSWQS